MFLLSKLHALTALGLAHFCDILQISLRVHLTEKTMIRTKTLSPHPNQEHFIFCWMAFISSTWGKEFSSKCCIDQLLQENITWEKLNSCACGSAARFVHETCSHHPCWAHPWFRRNFMGKHVMALRKGMMAFKHVDMKS